MSGRSLFAIIAAAALVVTACSSDSADDSAPDPDENSSDLIDSDPGDGSLSELEALCGAYADFVADTSAETADALRAVLSEPMPGGVQQELDDIVDGVGSASERTDGYVGPICGESGEETDAGDGDEGEAASTITSVCFDLHDAWASGDREAASFFGDEAAIDDLFTVDFSPPAGAGAKVNDVGDCFYEIPGRIAEIVIADSDLEAFAVEITWYSDDEFFDDSDRAARLEAAS